MLSQQQKIPYFSRMGPPFLFCSSKKLRILLKHFLLSLFMFLSIFGHMEREPAYHQILVTGRSLQKSVAWNEGFKIWSKLFWLLVKHVWHNLVTWNSLPTGQTLAGSATFALKLTQIQTLISDCCSSQPHGEVLFDVLCRI